MLRAFTYPELASQKTPARLGSMRDSSVVLISWLLQPSVAGRERALVIITLWLKMTIKRTFSTWVFLVQA